MRLICARCARGEHGRCKRKVREPRLAITVTWPCGCRAHSDPPCDYNAFHGWVCSRERDHDGPCALWPKSRKARKAFGRRGF